MRTRNDRWLDQTGLNLIRIVIGSYFMAIALGLITGIDPATLFIGLMPEQTARFSGVGLLFLISLCFMAGIKLRLAALMLVLFVLFSSFVENVLRQVTPDISSFWRDLTLACAVMLSYSTLGRRDLRKATVLLKAPSAPAPEPADTHDVSPRRVSLRRKPRQEADTDTDYDRMLRPLIAPTGPIKRPPPVPSEPAMPVAALMAPTSDGSAPKPQRVHRRGENEPIPLRPRHAGLSSDSQAETSGKDAADGALTWKSRRQQPDAEAESDDPFEQNIFLNI